MRSTDAEVAGTRISHPDRVIYPALGLTKLGLARYYEEIGEWMLPHVERRPLNLLRCPAGSGKPCFFQRHANESFSSSVKSVDLGDGESCVYVDSVAGLVALAQAGVLELHPWGAKVDKLERPDRIVFDLDPDTAVPWKRVVDSAKLIRSMMNELGLEAFLKTTGGKGLHVVVPIARKHSWDEAKAFSRGIALALVRAAPDLYVATASKRVRSKKIFVDYLRNARSASSVAAYSTRARPEGTVSMPIAWEEIDTARNDRFDVRTVPKRLKKRKEDPWGTMLESKASISRTAMRSVAP
jgi:bifunctional non-homologous end joining protein LigD